MTERFNLRSDERSHFETELLVPFLSVVSIAVIVLYATNRFVPGQFTGRGFHIPLWADVLAFAVLIATTAVTLQRPRYYEVSDEGLDVVMFLHRYRIPFAQIKEVVSVAERQPKPVVQAVLHDTFRRLVQGLKVLPMFVKEGAVMALPVVPQNLTTCDTGGAEVVCKDGRTALLSPAELSPFLNELERQFRRKHVDAAVVRQVRVQIE